MNKLHVAKREFTVSEIRLIQVALGRVVVVGKDNIDSRGIETGANKTYP